MNIAIIGCGYIGSKVAAIWRKKGHHITATTRTPEKLPELSRLAQKGLIFKGDEEELIPLITNNDAFLVAIAADNREHYHNAYLQMAQLFRHLALEMDLPRILIYTGTTSVYGDYHGRWVDEGSELLAKGEYGKILIEAETTYLSLEELGWSVCVLRLAEIYGPGRELSKRIRQFTGHLLPGSGDHYTNMVHKDDCAAAIDYVLRHQLEGIFNLADDEHPTRKALYDQVAEKFHLPKVKWDPTHIGLQSGNRRVSNHKIKDARFSFKYPHRVLE